MRRLAVSWMLLISLLLWEFFPSTPSAPSSSVPAPTLTPAASQIPPGFTVRFHPDGELYVGDLVSVEVSSPPKLDLDMESLYIQVDPPSGQTLKPAEFTPGVDPDTFQATLLWAWDTHNLSPGRHILALSTSSGDLAWSQTINLLPATALPAREAQAHWANASIACCTLFYITDTAAERDLSRIEAIADQQSNEVAAQLQVHLSKPIPLVLIPRLLGQGGFTTTEVLISYLDRNYAGDDFSLVLHHEMVHYFDLQSGGGFRPTLFAEGLAVYLSGGHFKSENLLLMGHSLLDLGWYLPLPILLDQFNSSQHEISYLEGSVLVSFMVNTWGWKDFFAFYRDIQLQSGESQAQAVGDGLGLHFGLSLSQLEDRFIRYLTTQADLPDLKEDLGLTVDFYDTMRRYQQLLDPSAYYLHVWLPDPDEMRQRGIVADYLRHPDSSANLANETLLVSAVNELRRGQYAETERDLSAVKTALNALQQQRSLSFDAESLAQLHSTAQTTVGR